MTKLETQPELIAPLTAAESQVLAAVNEQLLDERMHPRRTNSATPKGEVQIPLKKALMLTEDEFEHVSEPQLRRLWGEAVAVEGHLYRDHVGPHSLRLKLMRVVAICSRWVLEAQERRGEVPF